MSEENKTKKKFYQKWWFWVLIIFVVIPAIAAFGSNGDDNVETGKDSGKTSGSETGDTSESEKKPSVEYKINDTVKVGDLEYTITDITDTKQIGTSSLVSASTESNFVIVTFKVKNLSNREITLTSANFRYFVGKSEYEPNASAGIYLPENGFYCLQELGAGLTKTIAVVYEIPSEHTSSDYVKVVQGLKSEKIYCK